MHKLFERLPVGGDCGGERLARAWIKLNGLYPPWAESEPRDRPEGFLGIILILERAFGTVCVNRSGNTSAMRSGEFTLYNRAKA